MEAICYCDMDLKYIPYEGKSFILDSPCVGP